MDDRVAANVQKKNKKQRARGKQGPTTSLDFFVGWKGKGGKRGRGGRCVMDQNTTYSFSSSGHF